MGENRSNNSYWHPMLSQYQLHHCFVWRFPGFSHLPSRRLRWVWSIGGTILTVETEVLAAKPVTVPLCSQLHYSPTCEKDQASAGRIRHITTSAMTRLARNLSKDTPNRKRRKFHQLKTRGAHSNHPAWNCQGFAVIRVFKCLWSMFSF